jgi:hypothetical protein
MRRPVRYAMRYGSHLREQTQCRSERGNALTGGTEARLRSDNMGASGDDEGLPLLASSRSLKHPHRLAPIPPGRHYFPRQRRDRDDDAQPGTP